MAMSSTENNISKGGGGGKRRSKEHLVFGVPMTVAEIATTYGLKVSVVASRLARKGLSSRHVTAPVRKAKTFTIQGVTKTVNEWADFYGVTSSFADSRLEKGVSLEEASIRAPISFQGKSMPLGLWAKLWGLDSKKLSSLRGRSGLSMQEIQDRYVHNG